MRRYDKSILKAQLTYCMCFMLLLWFVIYFIPDYIRSVKCTESTYATVIDIDSNSLLSKDMSYDYTLHIIDTNMDKVIHIRNCRESYRMGQYITVEYSSDKNIFRIPNMFY